MERLIKAISDSATNQTLKEILEAGSLLAEWSNIVGKKIADNARPAMLKQGVLTVVTKNPVWSHQLTLLKPRVIDGLREAGFKVNEIRFKLGLEPEAKVKKEEQVKTPPDYSSVPNDIGSKRLKKAVASYAAAVKTRANRDPSGK